MTDAATQNLPDNWRIVRFGDVVRNVKVTVDPETSGLERYVAGGHMETDDLHIRSWGTVGDGYLGPAFHRKFVKGQVLYGSRRTYLRKVAVAEFDGICANTTFVLEPKGKALLPELLPLIMQTEAFTEHSIKQSKGSTNPYVNWKDLAWYEFPLPPLDEQRRIADTLWAADESLEKTQAALGAVRVLVAVVRTAKFGSSNTKTKLVDLCEPDGIQIGPFGSQLHAADYVEGQDGVPVVMPSDMANGYVVEDSIARITPRMANKLSRHRVIPGDILLPRRGDLDRRALILPKQAGWICGTGSIRIRLRKSVPPKAVWHALSTPRTIAWLERYAVGTTMPNLNTKIVSSIPVRLPEMSEIPEAIRTLDLLEQNYNLIQSHLDKSKSLRTELTNSLILRV